MLLERKGIKFLFCSLEPSSCLLTEVDTKLATNGKLNHQNSYACAQGQGHSSGV